MEPGLAPNKPDLEIISTIYFLWQKKIRLQFLETSEPNKYFKGTKSFIEKQVLKYVLNLFIEAKESLMINKSSTYIKKHKI